MNKRTKLAIVIGAVAAVISALVLMFVFWDKLLGKFPHSAEEDELPEEDTPEEPIMSYTAEETADFADLGEDA